MILLDPECYRLAQHVLQDFSTEDLELRELQLTELTVVIQNAIDEFVFTRTGTTAVMDIVHDQT